MKQKLPHEIIYDRGAKEIEGVKILTPSKSSIEYQRRSLRKKFRARAGIEPVIGHLKQYFRMEQNYYQGVDSPKINALLSVISWNTKKAMKKIKKSFLDSILYWINSFYKFKYTLYPSLFLIHKKRLISKLIDDFFFKFLNSFLVTYVSS